MKRIIPAVASTNAVIAATCAMEVFKVATSCANPLQNYLIFNDSDGIYTYAYEAAKNEDCLACSQRPRHIKFSRLVDFLQGNEESEKCILKSFFFQETNLV